MKLDPDYQVHNHETFFVCDALLWNKVMFEEIVFYRIEQGAIFTR